MKRKGWLRDEGGDRSLKSRTKISRQAKAPAPPRPVVCVFALVGQALSPANARLRAFLLQLLAVSAPMGCGR